MKPLDERKAYRKEQRRILGEGNVIPDVNKNPAQQASGQKTDIFSEMTDQQLVAWVESKGHKIPDDVASPEAAREYARNLNTYLESDEGKQNPDKAGW